MAATLIPLPTELTTPPVTKIYLALMYEQTYLYHEESRLVTEE